MFLLVLRCYIFISPVFWNTFLKDITELCRPGHGGRWSSSGRTRIYSSAVVRNRNWRRGHGWIWSDGIIFSFWVAAKLECDDGYRLEIEISTSRHQHDEEGRYTFGLCMSTLWRPYICKGYWNKLLWSKESHFVWAWLRYRSTMTACNDRRWVDSRSVVRLVEQVLLHEQEMCFPRRAATVEMGNDRCVGVISQTTKTFKQGN